MFQVISLAVIAALVALDRVSKHFAVSALAGGDTYPFLFGAFRLRYVENSGAAFSIFSDNTAVLSLFTALVIVLCLFVLMTRRIKSNFSAACLIMVVAGGIGNLIDRIAEGFVVDFIEPMFINFAVFNVADCFITVGAVLLMCYEIRLLFAEKKAEKSSKAEKND